MRKEKGWRDKVIGKGTVEEDEGVGRKVISYMYLTLIWRP